MELFFFGMVVVGLGGDERDENDWCIVKLKKKKRLFWWFLKSAWVGFHFAIRGTGFLPFSFGGLVLIE